MGVQLNIKDAQTVRLARELAGATGHSVTETIRTALEQAKADREADIAARLAQIGAIISDGRNYLAPEWRNKSLKEIMDSIYDENGLPA